MHSIASDGINTALAIVTYAKLSKIDIISITDHNEITATLRGEKIAERLGIIYFPGIELMFRVGGKVYELLGYFYTGEELKAFYKSYRFTNGFMPHFKSVQEVVKMIRGHGGAVVSPHPFGRKGIYRKLRNAEVMVDGIEVINGFTGEKRNGKAAILKTRNEDARKLGASDMHFFLSDMKKVYTRLESKKEITKELFWDALKGRNNDIFFKPVGKSFVKRKIFFQKPLCVAVYTINWPWLYAKYRYRKNR
ncbi:MAG: hypothetical protein PHW75_01015 [Patescibacteria group bacterium]|nr:hypothetical protein [Patescibacteria group bacterium]